jgi:hypothetical protein
MVKGDDVDEGRKCSIESRSEKCDRKEHRLPGRKQASCPLQKSRKGRAAGTLVDVCYFCYRLVVSLMLAFWACDALSVVWLVFAQCAVRSEEAGVTPLA